MTSRRHRFMCPLPTVEGDRCQTRIESHWYWLLRRRIAEHNRIAWWHAPINGWSQS